MGLLNIQIDVRQFTLHAINDSKNYEEKSK